MEDTGIQRGIWDGDAKAVQQCLTDIFTSVYTTCDIPENAIFGPCVLSHTSLYDSIAFIALKSTDKRTVPYIFRVDTSAANGSSEGLMWLRLVQSARDKEEQNLEAYIKNGQLFYRSLRRIAKDEELLVWYGKELTELLLLCPSRSHNKMNGSSPYTCLECSQRFQFEFPYVAHLRFRCPKRLHSADISPQDEQGGGVGTKDHGGGGGGGGKDQQQQEAPLGPGPKFCKAGPLHHYPAPSPESSNPPAAAGGSSAKPSTDFHNLGPLQLQLPSALTLLPPSFTSLCLPAQNWCAKCNASFRMTSDLVYHMRSHHKKEYAMEPLVKRRREEKLKCPICNESFRERHHLSRHMTSHN
ncbi:PREDICTED: PR domain zinc finger protein 8 [Mandrillus leucophaeus]|uniref:PR domain zinc finger protein 8 n=1 Tax=Mandrillus leucophaeus TaxID=9568 RepID=UPI0005F45687|nr:PREDICTED: PR domain zinc finger protein 8 [Mandrillus leucophaeus]